MSADFIASDYCYTVEMARALERHKAGTAHVIPILLRPVDWEKTPLGVLSPLPTNRTPVTLWINQDAAWLDIVRGINEIVRALLPKQLLSLQDVGILYADQGSLSGQIIGGKYVLKELLGEGGFGAVYKAQHLHLQRPQAVKILLEQHFQKSAFRERFLREAQTVAALDHPNIIHLDDFGVEPARIYLVMPFIQGGTLQDILQKHQQPLGLEQIVRYLEDICVALDYAHAKSVVHLDLKPLNLLVRDDGGLLLADFGLAHLIKQGMVEGGSSLSIGSPHYMAPEHIRGQPEKRSDLFSVGIILYRLLTGHLPFEGLTPEAILVKNLTEWPAAPRTLRPELPLGVEEVVGKALAKQPALRYQTAGELLAAFKRALAESQSSRQPSNLIFEESAVPSRQAPFIMDTQTPIAHSASSTTLEQATRSSFRHTDLLAPIIPTTDSPLPSGTTSGAIKSGPFPRSSLLQQVISFIAALITTSLFYIAFSLLGSFMGAPPNWLLPPNPWFATIILGLVPIATLGITLTNWFTFWKNRETISKVSTSLIIGLIALALCYALLQNLLGSVAPIVQLVVVLLVTSLAATIGTQDRVSAALINGVLWGLHRLRGLMIALVILLGGALGFELINNFAFGCFTPFGVLLGVVAGALLVLRANHLFKQKPHP